MNDKALIVCDEAVYAIGLMMEMPYGYTIFRVSENWWNIRKKNKLIGTGFTILSALQMASKKWGE